MNKTSPTTSAQQKQQQVVPPLHRHRMNSHNPRRPRRRLRRLHEIQVGMISDVIVRVVSYDQTRSLWQQGKSHRQKQQWQRRRGASVVNNTKTETYCLLSDGPGEVDMLPLIIQQYGPLQTLDTMLKRHFNASIGNTVTFSSQTSPPLLRLTNVECTLYPQKGKSLYHNSRNDHDNERVLIPTLQTTAMDVPWSEAYSTMSTTAVATPATPSFGCHSDNDNNDNSMDDEDHHHQSKHKVSAPIVAIATPASTVSMSHKTNKMPCTQIALCESNNEVIVHCSPLLDMHVNGVSLLTLPMAEWMNFLLLPKKKSTSDDVKTNESPTFHWATLIINYPGNHVVADPEPDDDTTTRVFKVKAASHIVQTLCGGLDAMELQSHSQYRTLAVQLLATLLPPTTFAANIHQTTVPTTTNRHNANSVSLRWCLQKEKRQKEELGSLSNTRSKFRVQQVTLEILQV